MTMKILGKEDCREAWDAVAKGCDAATFFHTPLWSDILTATFPERYSNATMAFEFGAGDVVVFPMVETGRELRGFFRHLESNEPGVYGGFLSSGDLTEEKIGRILRYLQTGRTANLFVFGNPHAELDRYFGDWLRRENFTHLFNLDDYPTEQDLLNTYPTGTRSRVKKSKDAGFVLEKARSREDLNDFFSIYQSAMNRWGAKASNAYPIQLFDNILRMAPENAVLWLLKDGRKTIAGALNFYYQRRCYGWHASSLSDYFKFGINNFFIHRMVWEAKGRGTKVFDCHPSGGHEGAAAFKDNCGAKRKYFNSYEWNGGAVYRAYQRLRSDNPLKTLERA